VVGRLLLACLVATAYFCLAFAAEDPKTATRTQLERIQSLRKQRPRDGVLVFYEAITRIGSGEREAAFALLRSLQGRKLGLIPVGDAGFEAVWDDPDFQKIREKLAQEESRTPDAPVAFPLGDSKLIPEGIAYDPKQDRFFIGSVAQKKIISANRKGEVKDFSRPGDNLDCVLGLFVDVAHEQLYAVSTNGFLDEAQKQRRNAVVRYDLKNGLLVGRYDAPDANQLNDLTIATYWHGGDLVGIQNCDKSRARHSHCARRSRNTDFRKHGVAIASSSCIRRAYDRRDRGRRVIRHRKLVRRPFSAQREHQRSGATKADCDYRCPIKAIM
jgi:hypothetical protein